MIFSENRYTLFRIML